MTISKTIFTDSKHLVSISSDDTHQPTRTAFTVGIQPCLIALAISQMMLASTPSHSATIDVDPPGTPGGCTLVEAVTTANSDMPSLTCVQGSGADTINLPANTVFTLSGSFLGGIDGNSGLPIITSTVTINGNGSTLRPLIGSRAIEIDAGTLSLRNTIISSSYIVFSGTNGGAIGARSSTVSLTNSTISNNRAVDGGGIYLTASRLTLFDSTLSGNNATRDGGAISARDNSFVYLRQNNTVSANSANRNGGGIDALDSYVRIRRQSSISGNFGRTRGGGLYAKGFSVSIRDSTISSNSTNGSGGAISVYNAGVTLVDSTVSSNSANIAGGGMTGRNNSLLRSYRSTISDNSAGQQGGAIHAFASSSIKLINSTLSGNTTTTRGGAVYLGGVVSDDSSLTSLNSTIVDNRINGGTFVPIDSGGGIFVSNVGANTTAFSNTVIANNGTIINDCGGLKPGLGINNWFEDTSCVGSFFARGDPKLGELSNNGGPTKTHAPLPDSGLKGAGDLSTCTGSDVANVDQRGKLRNNPCFIGAVEGIIDPSSFFVVPLPNGKSVIFSL